MTMPLNDKHRQFAEENHNLVYAFLSEYNLPESQYYDVIIFGYLRAVQDYCENPKLQKSAFSTVAWKNMKQELYNHKKYLSSKKRSVPTVSLSDTRGDDEDYLSFEDILSANDKLLDTLEERLLIHSLALTLPKKPMRIIRMKLGGYSMHDIAKKEHMTFKEINEVLDGSYDAVIELLLK